MKRKFLLRQKKKFKKIKNFFKNFWQDKKFRLRLFSKFKKKILIFLKIGGIKPYNYNLKIIFKNDDYVVINKEAGILIHPTKKNERQTVLNALLYYLGRLDNKGLNLPGPIIRLDRDTSGLTLFALSPQSKSFLGKKMMKKEFRKKYLVLVKGKTKKNEKIILNLNKTDNLKMEVNKNGKFAHTEYRLLKYFPKTKVSLLEVEIFTGRMHQIRVHLAYLGYPVLGDILYGEKEINQYFLDNYGLKRQFLHSYYLAFFDNHRFFKLFKSSLPENLDKIINNLE
jgi:23S rRNA pseudouridine1911/1915/1917 synthase